MEEDSNVEQMEFEQAMVELEKIVADLENGMISLKDSVKMYERGVMLKKHCEKLLELARMTIQNVSNGNESQV